MTKADQIAREIVRDFVNRFDTQPVEACGDDEIVLASWMARQTARYSYDKGRWRSRLGELQRC